MSGVFDEHAKSHRMLIKDGVGIPARLVSALQALTSSSISSPRPIDLGRGCAGLPGLRAKLHIANKRQLAH
jgi:hypothetical protein